MNEHDWPDALQGKLGTIHTVTALHGMSQNHVWRVVCSAGEFVVKSSANSAEFNFYQQHSPTLRSHGVHTPALHAVATSTDSYWIAIEAIPHPLPESRRLADPEQIGLLKALHNSGIVLQRGGWFRPKWTPQMTNSTLQWFDNDQRATLQPILHSMQQASQDLFTPIAPISADPNPNNWGIRDDGTLVLFDWERFTMGHPAIDLAITVPGLVSRTDFQTVAAAYLPTDATATAVTTLTNHLIHAKAWTIVELLSNAHEQANIPRALVEHLLMTFNTWLQQTPP